MKMNCNDIRSELPGYRNLRSEDPKRTAVQSHLDGCEACRTEAARLRTLWNTLGADLGITPSADFRARFWVRVRQEDEKESPIFGWLTWKRWTAVTAGALAAWTIGVSGPALWALKDRETRLTHPAVTMISSPFASQSLADIYFKGPAHE